jgi:hypothetical protein
LANAKANVAYRVTHKENMAHSTSLVAYGAAIRGEMAIEESD